MDANHRPVVRGTGKAIWERLKLIPFTVSIPKAEIDPGLPEKLRAEAAGVLAWAVAGCLEWQRIGLAEPHDVLEAGDKWKSEDDPFEEFFNECCDFDFSDGRAEPVANLRRAFADWCKDTGMRLPNAGLKEHLLERGCWKDRPREQSGKQVWKWFGIRLAI
jgi:putative DNA primase/helicase